MLSAFTPPAVADAIEQFKQFVIEADARRASQLLVELCKDYPLLAGIVTMLRKGSIDQALSNVGIFSSDLETELRDHMETLVKIGVELQKQSGQCAVGSEH